MSNNVKLFGKPLKEIYRQDSV